MITAVSNSIIRKFPTSRILTPRCQLKQQAAAFGTSEKSGSIMNAWEKSCYHEMNYKISEDATVYEAVEKFAGYDVGALVATDQQGKHCRCV